MKTFTPQDTPHRDLHQILLTGVAPRPIALVGTRSKEGINNLSPFSFFNAFASKPPIVGIGPAQSAINGAVKDTFTNIMETRECSISAVTFEIVEQMNLASAVYEPHVDEFVKCGLTPLDSESISAPRVKESPFQMECILHQYIPLAHDRGGNGNLILMEVVKIHVADECFSDGIIDQRKLDLVARLGFKWYARAGANEIFELPQPRVKGIGIDALPSALRESDFFTGNELAMLAGVGTLPVAEIRSSTIEERKLEIRYLLTERKVDEAWVLLEG